MCRVEKHRVPVCFYLFQPPVFYSLKSERLLHITTLVLFILKSTINFIVSFPGGFWVSFTLLFLTANYIDD